MRFCLEHWIWEGYYLLPLLLLLRPTRNILETASFMLRNTSSSALGYSAIHETASASTLPKIIKRNASMKAQQQPSKVAFRVTLVGHEAFARCFSPRCIHAPDGWSTRVWLAAHHFLVRTRADWPARRFSGPPAAGIVIDQDDALGASRMLRAFFARATSRGTSFPPPSVDGDFAIYGETGRCGRRSWERRTIASLMRDPKCERLHRGERVHLIRIIAILHTSTVCPKQYKLVILTKSSKRISLIADFSTTAKEIFQARYLFKFKKLLKEIVITKDMSFLSLISSLCDYSNEYQRLFLRCNQGEGKDKTLPELSSRSCDNDIYYLRELANNFRW